MVYDFYVCSKHMYCTCIGLLQPQLAAGMYGPGAAQTNMYGSGIPSVSGRCCLCIEVRMYSVW